MAWTINPDDVLATPEGRVWTPERSAEAWAQCHAALEAALAGGQVSHVVLVCGVQGAGKTRWIASRPDDAGAVHFDAALPGARHRQPIVAIARRYGVPIDAVYIRAPLAVALARNARRPADTRVPEAAIRSVAAQFEVPCVEEGFRRVEVIDAA